MTQPSQPTPEQIAAMLRSEAAQRRTNANNNRTRIANIQNEIRIAEEDAAQLEQAAKDVLGLKPSTPVIVPPAKVASFSRWLNGHTVSTAQQFKSSKLDALIVGGDAGRAWSKAQIADLEANGKNVVAYADFSAQEPYANDLYGNPPPAQVYNQYGVGWLDPLAQSTKDYAMRRMDYWQGKGVKRVYPDDIFPYDRINVADVTVFERWVQFFFWLIDELEKRGFILIVPNMAWLGIALDRGVNATWNTRGWWDVTGERPRTDAGRYGVLKRLAQGGHAISIEGYHFFNNGDLNDGCVPQPDGSFEIKDPGSRFDLYTRWGAAAAAILPVWALNYTPPAVRPADQQRAAWQDSVRKGFVPGLDMWGAGLGNHYS